MVSPRSHSQGSSQFFPQDSDSITDLHMLRAAYHSLLLMLIITYTLAFKYDLAIYTLPKPLIYLPSLMED